MFSICYAVYKYKFLKKDLRDEFNEINNFDSQLNFSASYSK